MPAIRSTELSRKTRYGLNMKIECPSRESNPNAGLRRPSGYPLPHWGIRITRLLRYYLYKDLTPAWPIALNEDDALPGSERHRVIFDRDRYTRAEQNGPEMRVCVTVDAIMEIALATRNELVQQPQDVVPQAGFILINDDPGGRMPGEDDADTGIHTLRTHDSFHLVRDIDEFSALLRSQLYSLHGSIQSLIALH
jgi:hypothetical protein